MSDNVITEQWAYQDNNTRCDGLVSYQREQKAKLPAILVVHDWTGRNAFAENKIQQLAALGYVGLAVDMYGEGRTGQNNEEKSALIAPLMSNRPHLRERIHSALDAARKIDHVDPHKIAVMGFCFGGLCALELARSGAHIRGAISVHGLLHKDDALKSGVIHAKILALHGYDDPMVKPEQLIEFSNEMTTANADWQMHVYGNTVHAFTNPLANDKNFGTVYNPVADKRSWIAITNFLREIFE